MFYRYRSFALTLLLCAGSAYAQASSVRADFNGDGFEDLAVGVPFEDLGRIEDAGAVHVIYGSASGLSPEASQRWSQGTPGIVGNAAARDFFGAALTVGDFNGDGHADLAIGVPGEDVVAGTEFGAGAVNVLYGTARGLTAANNQWWTQNSPGIRGRAEPIDAFGDALATGDFNGDGYSDLAIGVPNDTHNAVASGAVNILYGSAGGLSAAGNELWTQDSPGIRDVEEVGDRFGSALAAGDFNGDGYSDLAVGVPAEDLRRVENAGVVNVLYGSAKGLSAAGNQRWSQNRERIREVAQPEEAFGDVLAAGDFNGDGFTDLVIGVPLEQRARRGGEFFEAGAAHVIYGSATGLSATGSQLLTQDSPGILDKIDGAEWFGAALTVGDFNADGFADLAVAAPGETVTALAATGVVHLLYGSPGRLAAARNQLLSLNSPGLRRHAPRGGVFGSTLSAGDFNGDGADDLVIGNPSADVGTASRAGAVLVLYSSSRRVSIARHQIWTQNSAGIPDRAEDNDGFGAALVGSTAQSF